MAERQFRTLVEQLPVMVYSEEFAVGGSRMWVNPSVQTMFGFTPEESGQKNFWKTRLHPEDRDRVLAEEARCEQTGEPFDVEYRTLHRDGRAAGSATSACWSATRTTAAVLAGGDRRHHRRQAGPGARARGEPAAAPSTR